MKPRNFWSITFAMLGLAVGASAQDKRVKPVQPASPEAEPFALVELFTSEGCSSCPPADDLAADLVKKARKEKKRVFVLAFHVDYWDNLGWKDRYADAAYSKRQRDSAGRSSKPQVYTPQMIVNGKDSFVGSDKTKARAAIASALKAKAHAGVSISVIPAPAPEPAVDVKAPPSPRSTDSKAPRREKDAATLVTFSYSVRNAPAGSVLRIALVERALKTEVGAGENTGRTLKHENVVRVFQTVATDPPTGRVDLAMPPGARASNCSVIAFIEDSTSGEIVGADQAEIEGPQPKPAQRPVKP